MRRHGSILICMTAAMWAATGALGQICGDPGAGDCCSANGTPACDDLGCCETVCAVDPFCCDTAWDGICASEALDLCTICVGTGACCFDDGSCQDGLTEEECTFANGVYQGNFSECAFVICPGPACPLDCPPGALEEGEACGDDTNGGCNSVPPAFIEAFCGDVYCGTAWAEGGSRDTDWYLVQHGGGILSATLTSQFPGVCFIVDGIATCSPVVVGDIGCSEACLPIADASADLPPGEYVVFVGAGDCAGGGIFESYPCGSANDYVLEIFCTQVALGACCLPDGTCVDGVTQEECETPPDMGDCGDCGEPDPDGLPGCSDPDCEAIVCGIDPFCCDVSWDGICAGEALDLCDCGGGGGLGGVYQGDGTNCIDNPCGPPTGACCQCDGELQFCTIETEDDCEALGGLYLGDGAACETSGELVYESSPGLDIPDDDATGAFDTITVMDSFAYNDIKLDVVIDHTWMGDLCVILSKDGGIEYELIKRMNLEAECDADGCCGCSSNNMNLTLWDGAADGIEDQCADDLAGEFYSESFNLSNFAAGDAAGDWTIKVSDNAGGDTGVLVTWRLRFFGEADTTPCEDAFPDQCEPQFIEGYLDIKPGSCPNPFNPKSKGSVPMALLGTMDFDVTQVDVSSLMLYRADGVGGMVMPLMGPPGPGIGYDDVGTPFMGDLCDCHEMMGDGFMDLTLKFSTQAMAEAFMFDMGGAYELCLTGTLLDGTPFIACDCIWLVPIKGGYGDGANAIGFDN